MIVVSEKFAIKIPKNAQIEKIARGHRRYSVIVEFGVSSRRTTRQIIYLERLPNILGRKIATGAARSREPPLPRRPKLNTDCSIHRSITRNPLFAPYGFRAAAFLKPWAPCSPPRRISGPKQVPP